MKRITTKGITYLEPLQGSSEWYEDPDYRDEVLVRDFRTGKVLERMPGSIWPMPNGQKWLLV